MMGVCLRRLCLNMRVVGDMLFVLSWARVRRDALGTGCTVSGMSFSTLLCCRLLRYVLTMVVLMCFMFCLNFGVVYGVLICDACS